MTEKRFTRISVCGDWGIKDTLTDKVLFFGTTEEVEITLEVLNMLHEENQQLQMYKDSVSDILNSYLERDLVPIERIIVTAIAKELGVMCE